MTEGAALSVPGTAGEMEPLDTEGSGVLPVVPDRTRRLFWWLERVAPAVGSRWAVELWCTPPVLESSLRMPPGVTPGRPVEAFWDGHRVAGEEWGEGPPVYLVHGWGGQRAHLAVFVKPLMEAGYRVIAFDLPSHNESDRGALALGRTTAIECADAITAMIETHGPAHAVVAHSLGANSTVLAAADGTPVGRLVFLAPMGEFPLYIDLFAKRHNFGRRIHAGLHRRLEKRIGMKLHETNMTWTGRRANYPPLLLIHDPDDPDSPYAASERVAAAWPGSRLMTTQGLGRLAHYRILRHRPAIRAGVEFIGPAAPGD
jgi:pimeloyl-ACP methyl ester carboxylesterase